MSWDRGILDISPADMQDSLRFSAQGKAAFSLQALPQPLSPTKASSSTQTPVLASLQRSGSALKPTKTAPLPWSPSGTSSNGFASSNSTKGMSFQESLDEVEKLLDENVRHRYHHSAKKSPTKVAPTSQTTRRAGLSKSYFEFAPLQDPMMLLATATQDAEDEAEDEAFPNNGESQSPRSRREQDGDNENEYDADSTTSPQVKLKYFGAAAKTAYYKTYQELHGKSHLFVEKIETAYKDFPASSAAQSLRTSARSDSLGVPASPVRKGTILSSIAHTDGASDSQSQGDDGKANNAQDLTKMPASSVARRRQALQLPAAPELGQSASSSSLTSLHSSRSLHSPRVLFLSSCIANSQPAISILLRKENCRTYDFSHQGLGDKFIVQFAECLPDLPLVEAINVCGNRLSDTALNCLLLALENKPNLMKLDISENEIGSKSAKSIRKYISSSLCTIKTLGLNNADVDDQECTLFMIAFEKNKSVEQLFLRSNRIGQVVSTKARLKSSHAAIADSSNGESSAPGSSALPTGGESIGAMLDVNLNIAHLDLSWNLLKCASASHIGNALLLNYNLKELNLSYNACGDQGAMAFGQALRINTALAKLNLSYNSIGAKGAMVVASGLAANKGLRELILDGNSIGLESGRALMHASCARPGGVSTVCHLSLFECNLTTTVGPTRSHDQHGNRESGKGTKEMTLFNAADPSGAYCLDLSDPYENMIAHELLRIATFKESYRFAKLEYAPSSTGASKGANAKVELSRRPASKKAALAQSAAAVSGSPEPQIVPQNRSPVALLFAQIDKDQSGSVDFEELAQALREYGLNISEERLALLLSEYDYDHSGSLQEDEFQNLFVRCGFAMVDTDHSGSLNEQEIENVLRFMGIQDISLRKIKRMVAQYDMDGSGEIDEQEFLEFMKAEMLNAAQSGGAGDAQDGRETLEDAYEAIALREPSGVIWKIPTTGILNAEFGRTHEHDHEKEEEGKTGSDRQRATAFSPSTNVSDAVVSKLVASVQGMSRNAAEQADFLKAVLADSDLFFTAAQAEELLSKQGELKSATRKITALVRILPQIVNRREAISLVVRLFDAKTHWHERFALRKQLGNMYSVLLGSLTNRYCFDLASPDDRAALKKLALIAQEEKQFSKNRSGRHDTSQHGNWENFRNATIDGKMALLTSTYILNALLAPIPSSLSKTGSTASPPGAAGKDEMKRKVEFFYVSTTRPPRGTKTLTKRRFDQLVEILVGPIAGDSSSSARRPESHQGSSAERSRQAAQLRWEILRNSVLSASTRAQQWDAQKIASPGFLRVKSTLDEVQQKLTQLEMLVSDRWLSCDQAAQLVAAFPNAISAQARAACIVFGRLVDVENFIKVRISFPVVCVWCRAQYLDPFCASFRCMTSCP